MKQSLASLIVALAVLTTAGRTLAAEHGPFSTVRQFIDAFNRGDSKTALAACASPAFIIDDIPPHRWYGTTACLDWSRDLDAANKREDITGGVVILGRPWHADVTGERAYVVVPATYTYKRRGATVIERGAVLTVALTKSAYGWRIAAWSWAKR